MQSSSLCHSILSEQTRFKVWLQVPVCEGHRCFCDVRFFETHWALSDNRQKAKHSNYNSAKTKQHWICTIHCRNFLKIVVWNSCLRKTCDKWTLKYIIYSCIPQKGHLDLASRTEQKLLWILWCWCKVTRLEWMVPQGGHHETLYTLKNVWQVCRSN